MRTAVLTFVLLAAPARAEVPARYADAVAAVERHAAAQAADKGIPALSVALVDDQTVVWAKGFGTGTPETVYRVGSVSKLFTDVAVMQLVEQGKLSLDAPVTQYLPDFAPENPFGKPVTLRHLMAHRSGLVREPPVGSYFDAAAPPLADTIRSLNSTRLLLEPGAKVKYSNAAIAAVGFALERTQRGPFARYVRRAVLDPLGMRSSDFEPRPDLLARTPKALMWTYHGREFAAPTFELGESPAGCMYSCVTDLARFASCLFAGGKPVLKPESVREMLTPQFGVGTGRGATFGLGFMLDTLDGRKLAGHGGAIYGYSTELAILPDDKLAAVVVSSRDVTNAVTTRLAQDALRLMLAAKAGEPLPTLRATKPLAPEDARKWAGRYEGGQPFELTESAGRLYLTPDRGGFRTELRAGDNGELVVDDRLGWGQTLTPDGENLLVNGQPHRRVEPPKPPPCPAKWAGLVGEYGPDHNTLYVLEKNGRLYALIEWVFLYPLTEESETVFAYPNYGLYHDEKLVFTRDAAGRATKVTTAGYEFARRPLGERPFRVEPARPVADLKAAAKAATPPEFAGEFASPDLADVAAFDPSVKSEVRYASADNFLGTPVYDSGTARLQRPAAEALARANRRLEPLGYGLLVYDGYRPWWATQLFWEATPPRQRNFVADPARGSRHNRGCAVDLTLYDRATGRPAEMVSGYDEFTDRAYPDYPGGTSVQRWHRDLLRRTMEAEGFTVYEAEWWHFDHRDWKKYPVMNANP